MKKLLFVGYLLIGFVAFAVSVSAQTENLGYTGKVETAYDSKADSTDIELKLIPLTAANTELALFNVAVQIKGKKLVQKPSDVMFIVQVQFASDHNYPVKNQVSFTSGGKEIGQISLMALDRRTIGDKSILETLGTKLDIATMQKLGAQTQAVTFKIAETTFTISPDHLRKLVEFDRAITP